MAPRQKREWNVVGWAFAGTVTGGIVIAVVLGLLR